MADIAMCNGKGCSKREQCYRFTAPVNYYWQPYLVMDDKPKNGCDKFLSNKRRVDNPSG